MAKYTQRVADEVKKVIPAKVIEALAQFGWNEFGIYESVKEVINKVKFVNICVGN